MSNEHLSATAITSRTHQRIDIVPDTRLLVSCPRTHRIIRVARCAANGSSQKVTPTFTHTPALTPAEARRIRGTASQTHAQTVRELMNDDASFQVTIAVWVGRVPEVHPAPAVLTVRRGHKVGVVVSAAVLGVGNHGIVLLTTSAEVVLLEVPRHFVEAVTALRHLRSQPVYFN